jgi:hypothetical protein
VGRAAIRFDAAGQLVEAVSPQHGARALRVYVNDGQVVEEDLPCRYLRERAISLLFSGW